MYIFDSDFNANGYAVAKVVLSSLPLAASVLGWPLHIW